MEKWIKGEWISGPELLAAWKIRDFQLIEHIRNGLQSYDKKGKIISRPLIFDVERFFYETSTDRGIKNILRLLRESLLSTADQRQTTLDRYEPELRKEWAIQHISDFLFRVKDVSDFEAEHGFRAASVQVVAISADDYIKQRKTDGAKVDEIASELWDRQGRFKMTDLDICRKLGLDTGSHVAIGSYKKRSERLRKKKQETKKT